MLAATNNHYKGKAAVNAIDLKCLLGIKNNPVPDELAKAHPHVADEADESPSAQLPQGTCTNSGFRPLRSPRNPSGALTYIKLPFLRCPLADLAVVTAQTGDEFADTGQAVTEYILPLMREHGIRYLQLARHGHLEAAGITVLEDSRSPSQVYLQGDYRESFFPLVE